MRLFAAVHRRVARSLDDRGRDEDGVALIMVMFVTILVVALLGAVVAATTVNLQGAGTDRKRTQTSAAAEAGIDQTLATLQLSTGASVPCSVSGSISSASYTTTVAYYATYPPSGTALTCSNGSVSGTPKAALLTSTGSSGAPYVGAATTTGNRTMTALVRLVGSTATGPLLDKAVFSDQSVALTNAWKLISVNGSDASFYTNGNFGCNSTPTIAGSVYAQGTASLTNACTINGDLWANGNIDTSTNGINIGGSIKSSTGGLSVSNTPITVGKDVLVKTTCCGGSPTPKAGNGQNLVVGGTISTGVSLPAPPSENFPQITFDTTQFPGYSTLNWADWERANATTNGAPSWSSAYNGDCTAAGANYSLNGPLTSPSTPTIIDATGCSQLSFNSVSIKLKSDLTVFVKSFYSTNGVSITSADGANHIIRFIVPWPSGATACANSGGGTMTFDAGGTVLPSNVQMLLYTPGQLKMTNTIDFYGQAYGCTLDASVNVTVRYVPVGAGGGGSTTTTPYSVDVAYLRDS